MNERITDPPMEADGSPEAEFLRGRQAERQAIIKWLRKNSGEWFSNIPDNGQCPHGEWSWEGCETCGNKGIAGAIERGEHRSNK